MRRPGNGLRLAALLGLALVSGCSESAHPGHLKDVAQPRLALFDTNQSPGQPPTWRLSVSNLDARGRCLQLGEDLAVSAGSAPQRVFQRGKMERPGRDFLADPVCNSPLAEVSGPGAPAAEDTVLVKDATLSLQAVFPSFLAAPRVLNPPASVGAGQSISVTLSRPLLVKSNASFIRPASPGDPGQTVELTAAVEGTTLTLKLPADLAPQKGEILLTELGELPATTCGFAGGCSASLRHSFGWPLEVVAAH